MAETTQREAATHTRMGLARSMATMLAHPILQQEFISLVVGVVARRLYVPPPAGSRCPNKAGSILKGEPFHHELSRAPVDYTLESVFFIILVVIIIKLATFASLPLESADIAELGSASALCGVIDVSYAVLAGDLGGGMLWRRTHVVASVTLFHDRIAPNARLPILCHCKMKDRPHILILGTFALVGTGLAANARLVAAVRTGASLMMNISR